MSLSPLNELKHFKVMFPPSRRRRRSSLVPFHPSRRPEVFIQSTDDMPIHTYWTLLSSACSQSRSPSSLNAQGRASLPREPVLDTRQHTRKAAAGGVVIVVSLLSGLGQSLFWHRQLRQGRLYTASPYQRKPEWLTTPETLCGSYGRHQSILESKRFSQ